MQTEWRSKLLKRNADELKGSSWTEAQVQTEEAVEEAKPVDGVQTETKLLLQAITQTEAAAEEEDEYPSRPPTELAIDFHLLRATFKQLVKDLEGYLVWAEVLVEAAQRPIAAGRTQALSLSGDSVEWNAEMRLHLPVHVRGSLVQRVTVWAADDSRAPRRIGAWSGLLETKPRASRLHLEPPGAGEVVLGPISASLVS